MRQQHPMLDLFCQCVRQRTLPGAQAPVTFCDPGQIEAHGVFTFPNFKIDLAFVRRGAAPGLRNLLTARVFQLGKSPLYLSLSATMLALDPEIYVSYDYLFVATPKQLREALDQFFTSVATRSLRLIDYLADPAQRTALFARAAKEINDSFEEEVFVRCADVFESNPENDENYTVRLLSLFRRMQFIRRSTAPFTYFYSDQPLRALTGMRQYADRDGEIAQMLDLPEEKICFSDLQKDLYLLSTKSGVPFALHRILLAILLSILAGVLPAAVLFLPLYFLCAGSFSPDALFTTAATWEQARVLALPTLLFGPVVSMLLLGRRILYRFLYGKNDGKYYADMETPAQRRGLRVAGSAAMALLFSFVILLGNRTVVFENERFGDAREFFSLGQTYYGYGEIRRAGIVSYYRSGSGRMVYGPHLELILSGGEVIDFLSFAEEQTTEETLKPLLVGKGVRVDYYQTSDDFYDGRRIPVFESSEEE